MKFHKLISYLAAFLYILLGLITIGSIINGTEGLYINLIVGVFFTAIGYYLYAKAKNIIELITGIKQLNAEKKIALDSIKQFLFFEKIFILISLLLGMVLLSAVISRAVGETLPIFG